MRVRFFPKDRGATGRQSDPGAAMARLAGVTNCSQLNVFWRCSSVLSFRAPTDSNAVALRIPAVAMSLWEKIWLALQAIGTMAPTLLLNPACSNVPCSFAMSAPVRRGGERRCISSCLSVASRHSLSRQSLDSTAQLPRPSIVPVSLIATATQGAGHSQQ